MPEGQGVPAGLPVPRKPAPRGERLRILLRSFRISQSTVFYTLHNDNELLSVPGPHKCSKPCNLSLSLEPSELIKHNPRAVPLLLRWKR